MSREFEGEAFGIKGKYKEVNKLPVMFKPCIHVLYKFGRLRENIVTIHGAADGTTKVTKVSE